MNKNDFNLIHSFIDVKNQKFELNYALVSSDGIYATDIRRAIKFHIPLLGCEDVLASKKMIKCVAGSMDKDSIGAVSSNGVVTYDTFETISLDNRSSDFKYPDVNRILDVKLEYGFELENIDDLHFELTQKECYIDDVFLNPIIEYSGCDNYIISFDKQKIEDGVTNTGRVKIVGVYSTEDESDIVKFTTVVVGREFKTQAKEQLLMEL